MLMSMNLTDEALAAMLTEDRNRVLDAWLAEARADLEYQAELELEYDLMDQGPLPGYDAYDMAGDR